MSVHAFSAKLGNAEHFFLYDVEGGSLHQVDALTFRAIKGEIPMPKDVAEEIAELTEQGLLNAPVQVTEFTKPTDTLKALCLNVCHDCNLKCKYCFASEGTYNTPRDYMSADTAKASVDFLIKNSGTRSNLELDFFGGEPLLTMPVVKDTVVYAREQAQKHGKEFTFTITTNCLLLNADNARYINENMDNAVLSIDGRECVHDNARPTKNGKGSYALALKNALAFRKIRGDKKYYVRGTFTADNLDFASDAFAIADAGFDQISIEPVVLPATHPMALKKEHLDTIKKEYDRLADGMYARRKSPQSDRPAFNFFHFMIDLNNGPCVNKRLTGCGAGTEYLAVSPNGDLYPCHQFVGNPDYKLGTVRSGITNRATQKRLADVSLLSKPKCNDCHARYHCGGGCMANALNLAGDINGTYEIGCEMTRKRHELSLALEALKE